MDLDAAKQRAMGLLKRLGAYKYVLLVIAAGAALLLWPTGGEDETIYISGTEEESFSVSALETQLEEILSRIDGAGEVSVMLTVKSGMERVLAQNEATSGDEAECETVVISTGSGKEEVVVLTQRYPDFQGALVVCPGGGEAEVRLLITQAVAALTGLGSGRITVCKGGQPPDEFMEGY